MPCPSWCALPPDHDLCQTNGETFRYHRGRILRPVDRSAIAVHTELCSNWNPDAGSCGCAPVIRLAGLAPDRELSANEARWIALALLSAASAADAAQASSARPELAAAATNGWRPGLDTLICIDCSAEVHPDSTPDLDRCWQCAARADAEAGR